MQMLLFNLSPFFYPPDNESGTAIEDKALSVDGIEDALAEIDTSELEEDKKSASKTDDKADSKVDKEEKEDEKKDEKTVEDELEAELEEDQKDLDENLELALPVRRKEILAKYPDIFKDFPYLEKAYYREQAYAEV